MSTSEQAREWTLEGELVTVAEAGGERLRADTEEDADAAKAAAEALMKAATSAMSAGHSLADIARAEAHGKETLRHTLRGDALRLVERSGRRAREAEVEHHRAIARAVRLGLPMREIAHAAEVTHGTIRAISSRLAAQASVSDLAER